MYEHKHRLLSTFSDIVKIHFMVSRPVFALQVTSLTDLFGSNAQFSCIFMYQIMTRARASTLLTLFKYELLNVIY
jgi:hypothetical protein